MGAPVLSLGLGIDFGALDKDLGKVADRIESLGKAHSLKLGATVKDVASGQFDPEKLGAAVAQVGTRLSEGVASGVRASSGLMLGLGAHINTVLDRLAGSAITIFERIDAAMKFPIFDTAMKSAQLKLTNFTKVVGRGPLSSLDLALGGGMGKVAQTAARVAKVLFDQLAAGLQRALAGVAAGITGELKLVTAELGKVVAKLGEAKSEAAGAVPIFGEMAAAAAQAGAPPPSLAGPLPPRSKVPGVGRRIGFKTGFAGPAPAPVAALPKADRFAEFRNAGVRAAAAIKTAVGDAGAAFQVLGAAGVVTGRTILQVGAAFVSVPLRGVIAVNRLSNFLSSLGSVGKKSFSEIYEKHGLFATGLLYSIKGVTSLTSRLLHLGTLGVFRKHEAGAKSATLSLGNLGAKAKAVGAELALALGFAGAAFGLVGFLKKGVKAASDLNETVSRSKVVFGDSFGVVQKQADAMSKKFGITRQEQLDVASGFGAMAQGAGMAEAASAEFSNKMTVLAADFSSSVNLPFAEAADKLRSALAGQSEPLREFGVWLDEDTVKAAAGAKANHALAASHHKAAKAAATVRTLGRVAVHQPHVTTARAPHAAAAAHAGTKKQGAELDNLTKLVVRADLAMKGLSYTEGDLNRTGGEAANQFRKAGGGVEEFATRVGEILLPAAKAGAEGFNELLATTIELFDNGRPLIESWGESIKTAFESVGVLVRNFSTFVTIAKLRIGAFVSNTIAWLGTFGPNAVIIFNYVRENWWDLLVDLVNLAKVGFTNLLDNADRFGQAIWDALEGKGFHFEFKPLLDGFEATAKKFPELIRPELIDVEDQVGKLMEGITAKETARTLAVQKAGPAPKKPGAAMEPEKKPEYRLASAVEIGSKEAYSAIAKSQAGGKTTTGAVKDLNATARQQLQVNREHLALAKAAQGKPPLAVQVK